MKPAARTHLPAVLVFLSVTGPATACTHNDIGPMGPYQQQVRECNHRLESGSSRERSSAAETLGFLRTYASADLLARALADPDTEVRRKAALSLGWCGRRQHIDSLLKALADSDWVVRQSAWVALTNLAGQEHPFDALADPDLRAAQIRLWSDWWRTVPADGWPKELHEGLARRPPTDLALGGKVTASTTYKGPPSVLTGGSPGLFWQTKNVSFPQQCTIDLGLERTISCVMVEQYGKGFCMTDYALEISQDGHTFSRVLRHSERSPPTLLLSFPPQAARAVRLVSFNSENPVYPTTFYRVRVYSTVPRDIDAYSLERNMRALGTLGGKQAVPIIGEILEPFISGTTFPRAEKRMVQAGLQALGKLGDPLALDDLLDFLDHPVWARYAADALGDLGGKPAALALIKAYPDYAVDLQRKPPRKVPIDDRPGFEAVDRMYETPYAISFALSRLPLTDTEVLEGLKGIAPLLVANLPGDFDGAMIYEPESHQRVTAYLLNRAGMESAVCATALRALAPAEDPPRRIPEERILADLLHLARQAPGDAPLAASWLPVFCRHEKYVPDLLRLLEHSNGWVRINAAKTLMFNRAHEAAEPLARLLDDSRPEAEYGYNGRFFFGTKKQGQDEYNAPSPNWREAFTRAVGVLGNDAHVPLLGRLLNDERNVLEVRCAAAVGLDQIGTPAALDFLAGAESGHPFHSIRLFAREALWKRGRIGMASRPHTKVRAPASDIPRSEFPTNSLPALVFIKGDNNMPNDFQIDIWRQTYSTTDSGPTYRLGTNLYKLSPARPDGRVTALTYFKEGYVADCEVAWDGQTILFCRRGGADDPWWHLYRVNADGTGLRQLTHGPYHDVQPVFLPDDRILFSSSRIGMRDEYHGYPATGLTVMNPDGSDLHCIGFNLGRDNEPTVLHDGRIGFSRLELFYSRLKTELTVQAVFPDGTRNVTLYGPERRSFWRQVTRASGEKWWGEAPPRHRVLRLTQPQPLDAHRLLCMSTGGATVLGPGRYRERVLPRDGNRSITSAFPMPDGRIVCASSPRTYRKQDVDLGLYQLDPASGQLTLIYNDPETADFEPRPLAPRPRPPLLQETREESGFTARFMCGSARLSRIDEVKERGKLVRIIEGLPPVARHHTHNSLKGEAWKNHTGTRARVLGTVPLAADGSFHVEVPADRLLHCQILDSDRRVVGNQLIWMYARPGETRSCLGCHETPDSAPPSRVARFPAAAQVRPVSCLPSAHNFLYRAKAWQKGVLTDEAEERTRTVRAVNVMGRP
jgi:HEAT repeat protein